MGWSIWSAFGKLLSWCTKDSGGGGYGVEGEWGQGFEDHFLRGVKELVSLHFSRYQAEGGRS